MASREKTSDTQNSGHNQCSELRNIFIKESEHHMKNKRNSSVELLRILSMLSIVAVHYLGTNSLEELWGGGISLQTEMFILVKTVLTYGVNLFVLITGYYMCEKTQVSVRKPIKLLFDIAFYGACMYTVSLIVGINSFRITGLAKSMFPIFAGLRWFVKAYIVMYCMIPYLSTLVGMLDKRKHEILIVVLSVFFSLWPSFLPNPPLDDYGYSFHNFLFLFVIAAYLKKYITDINVKKCWTVLLCCIGVTCVIQNNHILGLPTLILPAYLLAHNSPLVLLACCCVLLLFVKHSFYCKWINTLAASAFAVYLIHGDFNTMSYLFNDVFKAFRYQTGLSWVPHMAVTCAVIYLGCFVIDVLKQRTVDVLFNKLADRIQLLNYKICA